MCFLILFDLDNTYLNVKENKMGFATFLLQTVWTLTTVVSCDFFWSAISKFNGRTSLVVILNQYYSPIITLITTYHWRSIILLSTCRTDPYLVVIHSFIHSFSHLVIHPFIHPIIYSFFLSSIHSVIKSNQLKLWILGIALSSKTWSPCC